MDAYFTKSKKILLLRLVILLEMAMAAIPFTSMPIILNSVNLHLRVCLLPVQIPLIVLSIVPRDVRDMASKLESL